MFSLSHKLFNLANQNKVLFPSLRTRFLSSTSEGPRAEKSINEVRLLGRAGGEPQKRGSEEHPVVVFQLATHANYRDSEGELKQKTDWHRIVIFRPVLRDTVYTYLKKGQRVHVSGHLLYGEAKSEDGNPVTLTSIVAEDVIFFQS